MPHLLTRLAAAGLATFAISGSALAQDALEPDTVLATVNGYEITEDEAMMASQDFAEQLQRVPDDQRRAVIVDALIDLHLLAGAGEEEGLADSEAFQRRLAYQRARTLRTAYLVDVLAAQVDEEALQTAYDEAVAGFEPEEERKARHILVETEEDARAVIEELDAGADFAELATERSTGPSGPNGGDLGFFGRGRMVPVFEDAAFSLEVGSFTPDPVESRFGWHVIYLEEIRQSEAPSFAELAPQIQQGLLQQAFVEAITGLREGAAISYEVEGLEPPAAPE
ncbi:MAG: peptidylprolyl isomerase [Hyphomicrobiales bacterium]|jgi:peptidyl-prolyl cis-trans isomerase C